MFLSHLYAMWYMGKEKEVMMTIKAMSKDPSRKTRRLSEGASYLK